MHQPSKSKPCPRASDSHLSPGGTAPGISMPERISIPACLPRARRSICRLVTRSRGHGFQLSLSRQLRTGQAGTKTHPQHKNTCEKRRPGSVWLYPGWSDVLRQNTHVDALLRGGLVTVKTTRKGGGGKSARRQQDACCPAGDVESRDGR